VIIRFIDRKKVLVKSIGYHSINLFILLKCLSVDCQNGARCVVDENEEAKCVCAPGYEGDLCEINTDECASNPCLNNGRCVDGVNKYHCVCENKYIDKVSRIEQKTCHMF